MLEHVPKGQKKNTKKGEKDYVWIYYTCYGSFTCIASNHADARKNHVTLEYPEPPQTYTLTTHNDTVVLVTAMNVRHRSCEFNSKAYISVEHPHSQKCSL